MNYSNLSNLIKDSTSETPSFESQIRSLLTSDNPDDVIMKAVCTKIANFFSQRGHKTTLLPHNVIFISGVKIQVSPDYISVAPYDGDMRKVFPILNVSSWVHATLSMVS